MGFSGSGLRVQVSQELKYTTGVMSQACSRKARILLDAKPVQAATQFTKSVSDCVIILPGPLIWPFLETFPSHMGYLLQDKEQ